MPKITEEEVIKPKGYRWTLLSAEERFWIQVKKTKSCWVWTGRPAPVYGQLVVHGKNI